MDYKAVLILSCVLALTSAWSVPFYPVRGPPRYTRHIQPPPHFHPLTHRVPSPAYVREVQEEEKQRQRPKRDHDFDHHDHHDHHDHRNHRDHHDRRTSGVTGPVHTFIKTDKNANYKWGVRHHVGSKYAP